MKNKITVISSNNRIGDNIFRIFYELLKQVKNNRWSIWFTFKRDFLIPFNQTKLGLIWSIIMPLIPISAYSLLAYIKVIKTSEDMPFIVYIVVGLTIWMFMANLISSTMTSIEKGRDILTKVKYPIIAIIVSRLGTVTYDFSLRIVLTFIILHYHGYHLSISSLLLPLLLIPSVLISIGLGMIFSILNEIYKDIKNVVEILLRYGLFLSSVIFPLPIGGLIEKLNSFNPFNTYVINIREYMVHGHIHNIDLFLSTTAISIIIFISGVWLLYNMENRIKGYL
jgi:lipopolysaccharide transport system permease protein